MIAQPGEPLKIKDITITVHDGPEVKSRLSLEDARARLAPVLTQGALVARGGLLFKACLTDNELHFGAVPWIQEGERRHHYDILLPQPEVRHLIGTLTPRCELGLLCRNPAFDDKDRIAYRNTVRALGALFKAARPDAIWLLDDVTRQFLIEARLWDPAPPDLISLR